ncbi:MAG: signal peptidase I [Bacilli bacterium]
MVKKIITYIITTISILLFVLAIIILIAGSILQKEQKILRVFGYSYSVVATDSMEPTIMIGDIIIAKDVPYEDVNEEDIIVFYSEQYQRFFVHRVKVINDDNEFVTKGDNPQAPIDDETVTRANYFGVVIHYGSFLFLGDLVLKYRNVIFGLMLLVFVIIIIQETIVIIKHLNAKNEQTIKAQYEQEKEKLLAIEEQKIRDELSKAKQNDHHD